MPTYEYECKSCNHGFEVFQAMSDAPIKDCPQCGSPVRRLIFGGSGVIFKGSGFYSKDSKPAQKPAPKEACASCPAASSGAKCPAAEAKTA